MPRTVHVGIVLCCCCSSEGAGVVNMWEGSRESHTGPAAVQAERHAEEGEAGPIGRGV